MICVALFNCLLCIFEKASCKNHLDLDWAQATVIILFSRNCFSHRRNDAKFKQIKIYYLIKL
jgi:hypothetical protein